MTTEIETKYNKPVFDGRLQFHKLLGWHMEQIAVAIVEHNYTYWFDNLYALYILANAYLKNKDECKSRLKHVDRQIKQLDNIAGTYNKIILSSYIESILKEITEEIYVNGKQLLLSSKEDEEGEFDEEEFFRGSDL